MLNSFLQRNQEMLECHLSMLAHLVHHQWVQAEVAVDAFPQNKGISAD